MNLKVQLYAGHRRNILLIFFTKEIFYIRDISRLKVKGEKTVAIQTRVKRDLEWPFHY